MREPYLALNEQATEMSRGKYFEKVTLTGSCFRKTYITTDFF